MDAANSVMDTHVRPLTWAEVLNEPRNGILIEARAAIAAMREPTDEMMFAAENAVVGLQCFSEKADSPSYKAWQAMIDAALKDGK